MGIRTPSGSQYSWKNGATILRNLWVKIIVYGCALIAGNIEARMVSIQVFNDNEYLSGGG